MTTSTRLAPSQQRERDRHSLPIPATQPPPAVAGVAAAAAHGRHPFAQTSPCTCDTQPYAAVAQKETGPHSPSKLLLVAHQPPPAVINRSPRHTVSPRGNHSNLPLSSVLRICCCGCSACTLSLRISVTCIIAYHTPAAESSTGVDLTTGCQFQLWRTTVQESLRGYEGPSELVC